MNLVTNHQNYIIQDAHYKIVNESLGNNKLGPFKKIYT